MPCNLSTCMACSPSKLHVILDPHLPSLAHQLAHQLAPAAEKLPVVLFVTHHLTSGINFITHFVSHVLIYRSIPDSSLLSPLTSPCRHQSSPLLSSITASPHHSSCPTSQLFFLSNPTLHRHLAPLWTDFMDTRTALRFFSSFQFFSSFLQSLP